MVSYYVPLGDTYILLIKWCLLSILIAAILWKSAASFNLSIWNIVYHDTLARQSFIVTSLCIRIQRTNSGDMIKVEGCSR